MEIEPKHGEPAQKAGLRGHDDPQTQAASQQGTGLDLAALQDMQDALAGALRTAVVLRDPSGTPLTRCSLPGDFFLLLGAAGTDGGPGRDVVKLLAEAGIPEHSVPVLSGGRTVAHWAMVRRPTEAPAEPLLARAAKAAGIELKPLKAAALTGLPVASAVERESAAKLLTLLAGLLGRSYGRRLELRRRDQEFKALVAISDLVAEGRNLTSILNGIARTVTDVMGAKAALIRLVDETGTELVARAVHKLSWQFIAKGPIKLADSEMDRQAFAGEVVVIDDWANDPRTLYRDDMRKEGLVSGIIVAMIHAGNPIGAIRIYCGEKRSWTEDEKDLLRAVADQAAMAIINSKLLEDMRTKERVDREIRLGRQVQRRMIPAKPPVIAGFEIGTVYEPSRTIAGDFFDFIPIDADNTGIVVGDVMGKGVPAALWMASVRATLRANVEHEYDMSKILARVNRALCRDSVNGQFATMFYGVLDTRTRRLTYCNAGQEAMVLLRGGKDEALPGGSPLLGVIPDAEFQVHLVDVRPGDVLAAWTDGTSDAMNFFDEPFGRDRILKAIKAKAAESAEAIAAHVLWEIRRFAGLNARLDDITIVVAKAL